jgi:hypothetical protein
VSTKSAASSKGTDGHPARVRTWPILVAAASLLVLAQTAQGQWPSWPDPSAPRRADGSVNLDAPPPRTADGRVDLSGLWVAIRTFGPQGSPTGVPPDGDGTTRPPYADYYDIGARIPGGAPLQPWADRLKRERVASHMRDTPEGLCLPAGLMPLWTHEQPRQILQTPREVVIIWEAAHGLRQIFTDGRPLPDNDPQPWWYGYTTGRWEGDTLVATTVSVRDGMWLDASGTPLTGRAVITERIRRPVYGRLDLEITFDDPGALTTPFTVRAAQQLVPDSDLIEYICNENERATRRDR